MKKFLFLFCVLSIVVFAFHYQKSVYEVTTQPWTQLLAKISAGIVRLFDSHVTASGIQILTNRPNNQGFSGVSIEAGCNGIEACLILFAAIIAFPAPFLYKIKGIIYGFIAVQALNVVRVITLFYIGQWSMDLFDFAHEYAWQILIVLDAFVVFLIWLNKMPNNNNTPSDDGNSDNNSDDKVETSLDKLAKVDSAQII